jgi:hypothetical protein
LIVGNVVGRGRARIRRKAGRVAVDVGVQSPIYVSDKIELEESVADKKAAAEDTTRFKKFMEELKPSDFRG